MPLQYFMKRNVAVLQLCVKVVLFGKVIRIKDIIHLARLDWTELDWTGLDWLESLDWTGLERSCARLSKTHAGLGSVDLLATYR